MYNVCDFEASKETIASKEASIYYYVLVENILQGQGEYSELRSTLIHKNNISMKNNNSKRRR